MKISLMLISTTVSGGGKCILKTAAGLRDRGHDVSVYMQAYSLKHFWRARILGERINWTEEPHRIQVVRNWLDIPESDVIVATSWRTAEPAALWCSKHTNARGFYYVQHDEALWDGGDEVARTYALPLKMVTISTWLQQVMNQKYGRESLLLVTPVDKTLFTAISDNPQRPCRVLMLHHTFDWKGVQDGYDAFAELKRTRPSAKLVILGGRVRDPEIPSDAEYHFQPSPEKLQELYASCGIFLCSSWHEGLGMPAMEAMATEALLVSTDTGGCRDYAMANETALLSAPRDPSALAKNLIQAFDDFESLKPIRDRGQSIIRTFNFDENLDKLEAHFLNS